MSLMPALKELFIMTRPVPFNTVGYNRARWTNLSSTSTCEDAKVDLRNYEYGCIYQPKTWNQCFIFFLLFSLHHNIHTGPTTINVIIYSFANHMIPMPRSHHLQQHVIYSIAARSTLQPSTTVPFL